MKANPVLIILIMCFSFIMHLPAKNKSINALYLEIENRSFLTNLFHCLDEMTSRLFVDCEIPITVGYMGSDCTQPTGFILSVINPNPSSIYEWNIVFLHETTECNDNNLDCIFSGSGTGTLFSFNAGCSCGCYKFSLTEKDSAGNVLCKIVRILCLGPLC